MFGRYEDITKVDFMLTALSQMIRSFLFCVFIVPTYMYGMFIVYCFHYEYCFTWVLRVIYCSQLPPYHQLDELSSLLRARGGRSARHLLRGGDAGGAHSCGLYTGNGFQASRPLAIGVGAAPGPVVSEREASRAIKRDKHLRGTELR